MTNPQTKRFGTNKSGWKTTASNAFINGYRRAALWSSMDDDGNPLDDAFDMHDFPATATACAQRDCNKFHDEMEDELAEATARPGYDEEAAGIDFWLTRNGHGTGFWDRKELKAGELGEKLSAAAKKFGACNLYVGDDQNLHFDRE